jgi:predicted RND superfamily exporter protein
MGRWVRSRWLLSDSQFAILLLTLGVIAIVALAIFRAFTFSR